MKKYNTPEWKITLFAVEDVLMASDENETDKDFVDNLVVDNIANI